MKLANLFQFDYIQVPHIYLHIHVMAISYLNNCINYPAEVLDI